MGDDINLTEARINFNLLDQQILDVCNSDLNGVHKWVCYFRVLEASLYNECPALDPSQFRFTVVEENGNFVLKFKPKKKPRPRCLKFLPFCVGPCISGILSVVIRNTLVE